MSQRRAYTDLPKRFNTAGPCESARHYILPPLARLPAAQRLVDQGHYFVLHAPRQSGKTTFLRHFARELTAQGTVVALYLSCEAAEACGDRLAAAQEVIVREIFREGGRQLPDELRPPALPASFSSETILSDYLAAWCEACPRPVVVFFDEIDAVRGQSLISVLRQLRAGFPNRPKSAPWSVMLCGLRDVREYKGASGGSDRLGTASPFNIKVASLSLAMFTADEVEALLFQHTTETGQMFEPEASARIAELGGGQPWLVNALAREIVEEMRVKGPIQLAHVDEAKERLILARATHLDSLVSVLSEPRVRRVIGPLLSGDMAPVDEIFNDDISYVVDLGLVSNPPLRIANPIYTEVIARVLSAPIQSSIVNDPRAFIRADGRFDMNVLIKEFAAFWTENGDTLTEGATYRESGAQLVLMAFLHRVVNGGGTVLREFGIGRKRVDLLVTWPYTGENGKRETQREAIELKVWRDGRKDPLAEGLVQIEAYLEKLGLADGYLVLFDRRSTALPLEDRVREEAATTATGRDIRVLRA